MQREEAVVLTEAIRDALDEAAEAAECVTELLGYAKRTEAWRALGYESFSAYVFKEFKIERVAAWKRLTTAIVSGEVSDAAGLRAPMILSQRSAQRLRPKLESVKDEIRLATKGRPPKERRVIAERVIRHHTTPTPPAVPDGYRLCPQCEGTGCVPESAVALVVR